MNTRYLNERKIASQETVKKIYMIIAMVFGDFNLFGVVLGIIQKEKFMIGMCLFFLIIDALIFWFGVIISKRIDAARRYETIFGSDEDGFVTIGEMSTLMQQPGRKIFNEVSTLFRKKYFINCKLETRGQPMVVIYNAMPGENVNSGVGFIICTCGNCGTQNRIRAGSMSKCYACHAPLSGVVNQVNQANQMNQMNQATQGKQTNQANQGNQMR
ncbi:hypothetical protein SAMN06297422_1404 [Lachnospiraceae bacterium]|nr:hypothetical protein SAMN06297422_1404 [Lachnospiraceae bacterium]